MQELIQTLQGIVGDGGWATDPARLEPHLSEWRNRVHGRTAILLLPDTVEKVAAIVRACADQGVVVVPQGGNTGMCAGAVPDGSGKQVLLNLARLNKVRNVDPLDYSMVVEAGCILADVQAEAMRHDRYFPLSLGGEGSCQIGGNISTNAGGINVVRYGTMRDLVLGVEVVLASGDTWNGLQTLRKDTAGYDLKQLFIGSEGTLGIVTAAALKLFAPPGETSTALLALNDATDAVQVLAELRGVFPDRIQAFELVSERAFDLVLRHIPGSKLPFASPSPWYVLTDIVAPGGANEIAEQLTGSVEQGWVRDAIFAKNTAEQEALWRMRHSISEAEKREGKGIKHDISVPLGQMQAFLVEAQARLKRTAPAAQPIVFGHLGDGNLHYNVHLQENVRETDLGRLTARVSDCIYQLVTELGGSISAEHGIGVLKKDALARYADPLELELMRRLKAVLDPRDTLNRGKVI